MKIYPLKFRNIFLPKIWGGEVICKYKGLPCQAQEVGESWELSDLEGAKSIISNGVYAGKTLSEMIALYGAELLGHQVFQRFGNTFPLLVKFIDASKDLSVQVHPNDKLAKERHNESGKSEMWYVVDAVDGAKLYSGFSTKIDANEYVERVESNTFLDVIQQYEVKAGDLFFIPSGRVHAIGSGIFIAEIQQTSDVTYRIYDYNRKTEHGQYRELHTELAKDAIDYQVQDDYRSHYTPQLNAAVELVDCQYFHTNILEITEKWVRDLDAIDSFVIYLCIEGSVNIQDVAGNTHQMKRGELVLIPAATHQIELMPDPKAKLLEVYILT